MNGGVRGDRAVVTASRGKVELLRANEALWAQARVGDQLSVADALRTDLGEADVAIGGVRVRLHEASRLQIQKVAVRRLHAQVSGSIESEVEGGAIELRFDGSEAVAQSDGGKFFANADGGTVVSVAAVTGSVDLSGAGSTVRLHKGEVSRVAGAAQPTAATAALRRVLLSVAWPRAKQTNLSTLPLAGSVDPGSRVFVQGQPAVVEPAGAFRAQVPLQPGKQKISVLTIDPLGRRKQVESDVVRDDSLPQVKVKKKLWR